MDGETARHRFSTGLARLRRRWFVFVWLQVLTQWLLATVAAIAGAAAIVVVARPAGVPLVALASAVPLLSLAALAVLSWTWWQRPSDRQVARYAEEQCPELEERLISAADVLAEDAPPPMHQLVLASGASILEQLGTDRVVPSRALARRGAATVTAFAVALVAATMFAPHAQRAWQTGRASFFPSTVGLIVKPGDTRVVEGGVVPLRVRIDGVPVEAWSAPVTVVATAPHLQEAPALQSADGVFAADLPAGEHSFSYRVASGALASPEYHVTVRRQPRVERIAVRYEYPRFSGLAPRVDEDSGDIFAPAGTKVTVQVHTATPVASGTLDLTGQPVQLGARSAHVLEGQFTLSADAAYRVTLDDGEGLTSSGETEYFVRVMDDSPPDVRILRPGGDAKVTRLEEVVVEARADDDYGLSRFELVFSPQGGQERVVPLARAGGTSVTGQHTIYIEDLDVRPGDFVTYYARARDVGRGKPSTETRSDIFFLEVRPFNEEFEAAQSQAGMSGGSDGQFDDLARLQKDIIVATWRLDRRKAGGAGRSAQDVRTVATSQADVKAKATQLAARLVAPPTPARTRPGQLPTPPPVPLPQVPTPPNPMQRAVEAMGRAQAALEQLDTSAALPHENAALNELLRAQAEVKRRQVARQSSASRGRGGQSGNQDLSALFDRELQRQQQTNYEQRATTESREEKPEDETLRRLRELASRQDEVNREQRELARRRDQLTVEDMKRRLERLTREQEALRQQAEELARRMQRGQQSAQAGQRQQGQEGQQGQQDQQGQQQGQQGQSGQQSASSSGASGSRGGQGQGQDERERSDADRLRDAASEMAAAAGELQRESPGTASQRSQRALERLRAATRGVEGEQPDERRRIAGDLQAEARQLAEATRRLAEQAEAAATSGDKASVERLAAQQGRLAARADALERSARTLAERGERPGSPRNGQGAGGAMATADALRRAARDLSAERIGERLRQGAETARQSADGGGNPADAGRQLAASSRGVAQPLDRVADALGQVTGQDAESRKLSDALERSRRLRDAMASADREQGGVVPRSGAAPSGSGRGEPGQTQSEARSGEPGSRGPAGGRGSGNEGESARAQSEFVRQLRQQRELLDALQRENPSLGARMQSLEGWSPSTSAPGTEAWKQDRTKWEELKKDLTLAIERYESSAAARLAERDARQRLDAGSDAPAPEAWRQDVADYFRAIARKPRQ